MNVKEAREQVESLIEDRKSFIDSTENNEDNIFKKDIKAIKIVLAELEKKDRIINKMAYKIAKLNGTDQYCIRKGKDKICPHEIPTEKKCAECIKKYYEKRYR